MVAQHGGGEAHLHAYTSASRGWLTQTEYSAKALLLHLIFIFCEFTLYYHCLNSMLPGFGFSVGDFISAIGEC